MSDNFAIVQSALMQLGVPIEEIKPTASLLDDLAIDSTEKIELIIVLEQRLGTSLDEKQLKNVQTVTELVSFVDSNRNHTVG